MLKENFVLNALEVRPSLKGRRELYTAISYLFISSAHQPASTIPNSQWATILRSASWPDLNDRQSESQNPTSILKAQLYLHTEVVSSPNGPERRVTLSDFPGI